jgi:hypothetical protein
LFEQAVRARPHRLPVYGCAGPTAALLNFSNYIGHREHEVEIEGGAPTGVADVFGPVGSAFRCDPPSGRNE